MRLSVVVDVILVAVGGYAGTVLLLREADGSTSLLSPFMIIFIGLAVNL
jgi:hypothetical protein